MKGVASMVVEAIKRYPLLVITCDDFCNCLLSNVKKV